MKKITGYVRFFSDMPESLGEIVLKGVRLKDDKPYHRWRRIGFIVLYISIALIVASVVLGLIFGTESKICLYTGYAAIIGVIWYYLINFFKWRCPNCNKTLPLLGPVLECRYCKRSFMDSNGKQVW